MLYKVDKVSKELDKLEFYSFEDLGKLEKDLENIMVQNIKTLFLDNTQIMTIFQETNWQEEPDICAVDKEGNLILFELKRHNADGRTTMQILRYSEIFGQKTYRELNNYFKKFIGSDVDLAAEHKVAFNLEKELKHDEFNQKQKLIIIGNSMDWNLIESIDYWKRQGVNIEFTPYRIYKIEDEYYFEFFSKPHDYHLNPRYRKAVLFDTNKSYDENEENLLDMFENNKVSAYGNAKRYIDYINRDDLVLYYRKGWGVIGAGIVTSENSFDIGNERYKNVKFLTEIPNNKEEANRLNYISASELKEILKKDFYFASTIKTPYLTYEEGEKLVEVLKGKI